MKTTKASLRSIRSRRINHRFQRLSHYFNWADRVAAPKMRQQGKEVRFVKPRSEVSFIPTVKSSQIGEMRRWLTLLIGDLLPWQEKALEQACQPGLGFRLAVIPVNPPRHYPRAPPSLPAVPLLTSATEHYTSLNRVLKEVSFAQAGSMGSKRMNKWAEEERRPFPRAYVDELKAVDKVAGDDQRTLSEGAPCCSSVDSEETTDHAPLCPSRGGR